MTIQENIEAVSQAMEAVKNHCMCAKFSDDGAQYRIIYPAGMILDGVQATYAICGKRVALERIAEAIERHWKQSGIQ
jgi:hypothetical protein